MRAAKSRTWTTAAAVAVVAVVAAAWPAAAAPWPPADVASVEPASPLLAAVDVELEPAPAAPPAPAIATAPDVELALEAPRSWTHLEELERLSEAVLWGLEASAPGAANPCENGRLRLKTRVRGYQLFRGGNGAVVRPLRPVIPTGFGASCTAEASGGVFTTADPLGFVDGPSMYAFSRFNPSNFRDPLGLECLQIFGDEETKCSDYLPSMPEGQATKDYFENVEGATDSSNSGGERIRDGLQAAATAPFYVLEGLVAGIVNAPRELLLAMEEDAELRERVKELRGEHENWFEMARQLEAEGYDISYLVDGPGIAAAPLPGRPNLRTSRRGAWTSVSTDARSILKDVESRTKRKIPGSQRTRLADELRGTNHRQPVSKAEYRRLQAEYREQRAALIEAWERNTGQVWPRGAQAHHVIPTRYGGPNEWWNIHPAYQSVHQSGIHGSGSATQLVFPTPVRSSG